MIDPTNLWLTIHESIGHATELDRAMGYEAAYAGTSFATLDQLGTLRYGSPVMHVTGDRTTPHGLATVAIDDEGVAAQSFDLVRDGVLVGYQLDRRHRRRPPASAAPTAAPSPTRRCTCPSSAWPTSRCSRRPASGPTTEELIAGVERGIYIVGDKSWSIDMQRYNFQFTGQRFYRIEHGRLAGQLRDVAYQATTTEFWGSMEAVGGHAPPTCSAGPSTAARASPARWPRSATAARRAGPRRQRPQHPRGVRAGERRLPAARPADQVVERALAAAGGRGCVVHRRGGRRGRGPLRQQHDHHQRACAGTAG